MSPDISLLRVFDVIMEQRSVSRAADRLGLTQSAVSHALARLRKQLDDPLFVRTQGGLRPTPRATEIAGKVREGLSLLRSAMAETAFDPATSTRTFVVSASSYFCAVLLPPVVTRARDEAPNARFRIVSPAEDVFVAIEEGSVDLALGAFPEPPARFVRRALYAERLMWVGSADGDADPAARPRLSMARPPQPLAGQDAGRGEGAGLPRQFPPGPSPVTIHDPLSAGAFLARSDLVTLLPRQLARLATAAAGVSILAAGEGDEVELAMLWHARATTDPALTWLRGVMEAAAATLV